MLRTIDVSLETGEEQSAGNISKLFIEAMDDAFLNNVVTFGKVHGENHGVAPASLQFKTDADPEAMVIEVEHMAASNFEKVSATLIPTDEEIEEVMKSLGET